MVLIPVKIQDIAEEHDYVKIYNCERDWMTFRHPSKRGCGGAGRSTVILIPDPVLL